MTITDIKKIYEEIISKGKSDLSSLEISNSFVALSKGCNGYLAKINREELTSQVEGKQYFAFNNGTKCTRPIRQDLYDTTQEDIEAFIDALRTNDYSTTNTDDITKCCYKIMIDFCAVIDLESSARKTYGTMFEYFIGHCYARKFGMHPKQQLDVLNLDMKTKLPTDLIFDLGENKPKFHLPVKTSTRERVVQVWAHQRVLDGVYGTGRFWGTLACLSETKLNKKNKHVTEICLPDQWKLYQLFIAQMKRVYYLDLPAKYGNLNNVFPRIAVKKFGEFFYEVDDLSKFT